MHVHGIEAGAFDGIQTAWYLTELKDGRHHKIKMLPNRAAAERALWEADGAPAEIIRDMPEGVDE